MWAPLRRVLVRPPDRRASAAWRAFGWRANRTPAGSPPSTRPSARSSPRRARRSSSRRRRPVSRPTRSTSTTLPSSRTRALLSSAREGGTPGRGRHDGRRPRRGGRADPREAEAPASVEGGDTVWLDERTLSSAAATGRTTRVSRLCRGAAGDRGGRVRPAAPPRAPRGAPPDVAHLTLDADLAVVYLPLLPVRLVELLAGRGVRLVEVPEDEFWTMGPNVLALGPRRALALDGNPVTPGAWRRPGSTSSSTRATSSSRLGDGGPTCPHPAAAAALELGATGLFGALDQVGCDQAAETPRTSRAMRARGEWPEEGRGVGAEPMARTGSPWPSAFFNPPRKAGAIRSCSEVEVLERLGRAPVELGRLPVVTLPAPGDRPERSRRRPDRSPRRAGRSSTRPARAPARPRQPPLLEERAAEDELDVADLVEEIFTPAEELERVAPCCSARSSLAGAQVHPSERGHRVAGVDVVPDLERDPEGVLQVGLGLLGLPEQEVEPAEVVQELADVGLVRDLLVQGGFACSACVRPSSQRPCRSATSDAWKCACAIA